MAVRRGWALGRIGPRPFDEITGTLGDDTLTGTGGRDTVAGLGGDDLLQGLDGKDRLDGGNGNDTLTGGEGRDRLVGGPGGDVFRFEDIADSRPGKADVVAVYKGLDRLDLDAIDADKLTKGDQDFRYVAALSGEAGELAWSSDGDQGTIIEGDVDGDAIADFRIEISRDYRDSLAGTDGDDTLIGYEDGETINGGQGNNVVLAGGGDDSLKGGNEDILVGGDGDDTIVGRDGLDSIEGGRGDDMIWGNEQPGIGIAPATSPDNIEGGAGNDTIEAIGISTVAGGSGDDVITAIENGGGVSGLLMGGDGNDTITAIDPLSRSQTRYQIFGDGGSDNLTGGEFTDTIVGGAGSDTIHGRTGQDVYLYQEINDSTPSDPDIITKLSNNKTVDLSAIDANSIAAGNQAFTRVADLTGQAGQLRLRLDAGGDTFFEGDVDGDALADFVIRVSGDHLDFTSFVL